jgi:hypothetical protein
MAMTYLIPKGSFTAQTAPFNPAGSRQSYWVEAQINYAPLEGSAPVVSVQALTHIYKAGPGVIGGSEECGVGSSFQLTFNLIDSVTTKMLSLSEADYNLLIKADVGNIQWDAQAQNGAVHGVKNLTATIINFVSKKAQGPFTPAAFSVPIPVVKPA